MYLLSLFAPKQKSQKRIDKMDVFLILDDFREKKLSDESYKLVDIKALKKFLKYNKTDRRVYTKIKNDCDDFTYILQGDVTRWDPDLAFGITWVRTTKGLHALNVFIDTDSKLWFVEPQTDDVFRVPDGWELRFVMM